jgi:hypothetical protein
MDAPGGWGRRVSVYVIRTRRMDMKGIIGSVLGLALAFTVLGGSAAHGATPDALPYPDIPRITKEELKDILGQPGLVILDCRPEAQWRVSEMKLPGAVHEDPADVESWAHKYPKDAKIVIY